MLSKPRRHRGGGGGIDHASLLHGSACAVAELAMSRRSPMKKRSQDVVVITGASAGAGRATARAFAQRGAHIGLIARGRDGLEATRREVEEVGGRALVLPLDVARADLVDLAAAQVEDELG